MCVCVWGGGGGAEGGGGEENFEFAISSDVFFFF